MLERLVKCSLKRIIPFAMCSNLRNYYTHRSTRHFAVPLHDIGDQFEVTMTGIQV